MNQNLDNLRHSCAHLLAAAVVKLWPQAKPTLGPPIDTGFYYDFDFGDIKISETDFPKIEAEMRRIVKTWDKFQRIEISPAEARRKFAHNPYKLELIDEFAGQGSSLSLYQSADFVDLCRGGHVDKPKQSLKHFKLLSVAGAYWRGDEKNKMLTRIYGTAWPTQKELDHYLWQLAEAKRRDHRKIGQQQDLFLVSQDIGGGLPIFTPRGLILRNAVSDYIVAEKVKRGYQFVWTPHIARSEIYKKSGHWQKYDAMFNPMQLEDEAYVLKPMNCPHHFQIYLNRPRSYKELPLRIAENGTCYRYEKSGELNGLLRVRSVTIDDTHTFIRYSQTFEEINNVLSLTLEVFKTFGFKEYWARVSVHDHKNPQKYLGDAQHWERAEEALKRGVQHLGIKFEVGEGEAAFYGPKIDMMIKDALGRNWQLSTIQLDYNQPKNFHMTYIDEHGQEVEPAILHIAILGSIERFLGILIEHYAGAFPVWLAPVQVVVLPVSEKHSSSASKVSSLLSTLRVEIDNRSESLQKRIREAELQKIPYMAIVGAKEAQSDNVSVRQRGEKDLGSMPIDKFLTKIQKEIDAKII